jgi:hypothetical protein
MATKASTQVLGMAHPPGDSSWFRIARRLSLKCTRGSVRACLATSSRSERRVKIVWRHRMAVFAVSPRIALATSLTIDQRRDCF